MIFSVSILRKVGKTTIVTHGRLRVNGRKTSFSATQTNPSPHMINFTGSD